MVPSRRAPSKASYQWLPLLGVSGVGAVILSGIIAYQAFVNADTLEGLRGIHIRPPTPEERTVNPGGILRLTAMGDFTTMEIPVRADWDFIGDPLGGSLPDCANKQQCIIHAGGAPGSVNVRAQTESFTDTATLTIAIINPFTDELPGWADDAILSLNQLGIIRGYDDGRFGPGDPVTSGQFVTLLYRLAVHTGLAEELTSEECPPFLFPSIPADHFAFFPFCFYNRTAMGSVSSNPEPDIPALREQAATFIASLFAPSILNSMGFRGARANEPYEGGPFFDDVPIDHLAFYNTRTVQVMEIMTGNPNGDFGIGEQLNRAQAAVIIERIRQAIDDYNIEEFWQLGNGSSGNGGGAGGSSAPSLSVGCAVHNGSANVSAPPAPRIGSSYARHDLPAGTYSSQQARSACTQAIFHDLMEEYCGAGNMSPAYWALAWYGQSVTPWDAGDPHACP